MAAGRMERRRARRSAALNTPDRAHDPGEPDLPGRVRAGLTSCIDVLRASEPSGRQPWVASSERGVGDLPGGPDWLLSCLLHLARPAPTSSLPASLTSSLERHGLVTRLGDTLGPGRWEITSHRGVLAARDRSDKPGGESVYIGEDGLTFLEAVIDARPLGDVLEVGSGSGLVAAAAARTASSVTAVDIVSECVEATRVTAWLNGVSRRVTAKRADFTSEDFIRRFAASFECVAANLPGVPVPRGVAYSPAGDGGHDGLRLIRRLLHAAPVLLRRPTVEGDHPNAPVLLMRFQSLGGDSDCLLLHDIERWTAKHGLDAVVTYTSRAPVEVRNGLTAHNAGSWNPGVSAGDIIKAADAHACELDATQYYSATLVARAGCGEVAVVDAAQRPLLDHRFGVVQPDRSSLRRAVDERFLPGLKNLAEGFWEMGSMTDVRRVAGTSPMLLGLLSAGRTPREALPHLHPSLAADVPAARSLLSATQLLLSTLVDAGVLEREGRAA